MRPGLTIIGCATFLELAMSQGHDHLKHHHAKRQEVCSDVVTDVVTDIAYLTYDSEDVIVYVNDANQPVSTTTVYKGLVPHTQAPSTSTPPAPASESPSSSPVPPAESPSTPPAPSSELPSFALVAPKPEPSTPAPAPAPVPQPTEATTPTPSLNLSPNPSPEESGSRGPGFSSAIAYTPYNADQSCKSTLQVAADFQKISDYEVVRLYGTDCNQISNVIAATHSSVKLLLGIFDINSIQSEVQIISLVWLVSAVNGQWSLVNSVSVGNELVNTGQASASQVVAAIGAAKAALKAAGYNGPIATIDTMMAMRNNIELCTASDFCAINCHAFFDGNTLPEDSGQFVQNWVKQISEAAGGKITIVTESGWPHQGDTNNKAIPSPENQAAAIASLKEAFSGGSNLVLYNSYDDLWKSDSADTYGAEKYWGMLGDSPG
ncbi:MAG: hypothetical protein ALECFALPRED_010696 [Alectoria fallacina]|uniref:Uncharacterized protein n=1 Tax=Alectoria fallacina TaxID=1903189 RepID=A0A8H3PKC8_9LECA|nr:MAG: hypothetical protein ALECFALPRED_010696 [Alectoria fallacina]